MNQGIIGEKVGLIVQLANTSIQRLFIGHSEHFSSLNLLLDLVFKLGHVKHELIHFA